MDVETIEDLRELKRRCQINVDNAKLALDIAEEDLACVLERLSERRHCRSRRP